MFEESNNGFALYAPRTRGRLKFVMIQATSDGTVLTIDAANTEPGVTVSGTGGDYVCSGLPKGDFIQYVGGGVSLAESAGSNVYPEALSATGGTAAIETAITPGTAAAPANGSRVYVTFIVGRTG